MVIDQKTKVGVTTIVIIIIFSISLLFLIENQKPIGIIFFTNPGCLVSNQTDKVLEEIKNNFKDRVDIKEINVNMYNGDPTDSEEIRTLREKYQVYGVPELIINGREFTKKHTKDNIEDAICGNFIIKPEACI